MLPAVLYDVIYVIQIQFLLTQHAVDCVLAVERVAEAVDQYRFDECCVAVGHVTEYLAHFTVQVRVDAPARQSVHPLQNLKIYAVKKLFFRY